MARRKPLTARIADRDEPSTADVFAEVVDSPAPAATSSRGQEAAGDFSEFKEIFDSIVSNVELMIKGKSDVVRLALVAMFAEGHVLFEDLPGTGKSMLARALAASLDADTTRVQCTPDMLPGDITGSSIFDQRTSTFEFRPGPVFTNVLLADEINRATPKTQSALLEAMAERRVTADGVTYDLPRPFLVIGTQNPVEQAGTFPLPEAQLDRFLFRLSMGYLGRDVEFEVMFNESISSRIDEIGKVISRDRVNDLIKLATSVEVSPEVGYYIVDLVHATRNDASIAVGGSARASINLVKAARVLAASDGRAQVYPDDVRTVLVPVLGHRIIMNPDAILRGESAGAAIERIAGNVKAPMSATAREIDAAVAS